MFDLPLKNATKMAWSTVALADTADLLRDHANCERKAAAQCMSIIQTYPDFPILVDPLVSLAREELLHFAQVVRLMQKRGIALSESPQDAYVQFLRRGLRVDRTERLLDRLLLAAMIEARSCERLAILGEATDDAELATFFATLAREEAGHHKVFVRLAEKCFPQSQVDERYAFFIDLESDAIAATPASCAIH